MDWKDATSYSKGGTREPSAWTLSGDGIKITVVSRHIYNPGQWLMHCHPWFDAHDLGLPADKHDAKEAQSKALKIVRAKLKAAYKSLTVPE